MARTAVTFFIKHYFKSFCDSTGNPFKISSKDHKKILDCAGDVIQEVIIKEGDIKMFGRLGDLMIRKVKPKGAYTAPVDYEYYQQTKSVTYHFNDHSDGFIARILWNRKKCVMNDKHMWVFKPVRAFRRTLADVMKNKSYEYTIHIK